MHHPPAPLIPIILLPGLNGDPRVFAPQIDAIPHATIVQWIPPFPAERLPQYAQRLAKTLNLHTPCVIAGVSFGGIMAIELSRHLDTQCCVLIASSRDARGLPRMIRMAQPFAALAPRPVVDCSLRWGWETALAVLPKVRRRTRRLSAEQASFQRWAVRQLLTWDAPRSLGCPLLQIHGNQDRQFPAGTAVADRVIPGGGHLLTLTHSSEVNSFLAAAIGKSAA